MGEMKNLAIDAANAERSRRGRTSRQRGNAWERELAARLSGKRVGWTGGKNDVIAGTDGWLVIQAKLGGAFSEKYWRWIEALDARSDQLRVLIVGDAPGPGGKRRAMVTMDLRDFEQWFGAVERDK